MNYSTICAHQWSMYFAALMSWRNHPGFQRDGMVAPTMWDCAAEADEMLVLFMRRFPEEGSWLPGPQ